MGLDAVRLGAAIKTKLLGANCGAVDGPALTGLSNAIAEALVAELKDNATVVPGTMAAGPNPVTGVGKVE